MRRAALLSSLGLAIAAAACSDAGGSPSGGVDTFDAGPAAIPDSGIVATDGGGGSTWTDLYRDFFGKPAPGPGCKGTGVCHGAADQGGGGVWVCGNTQASCYQGITTPSAALLDTSNPDGSLLLSIALRTSKGGNMPQAPASYVFPTPTSRESAPGWPRARQITRYVPGERDRPLTVSFGGLVL